MILCQSSPPCTLQHWELPCFRKRCLLTPGKFTVKLLFLQQLKWQLMLVSQSTGQVLSIICFRKICAHVSERNYLYFQFMGNLFMRNVGFVYLYLGKTKQKSHHRIVNSMCTIMYVKIPFFLGIFGIGWISVSLQAHHCSSFLLTLVSWHQSEHHSLEKCTAVISWLFQTQYKSYWQLLKDKKKTNQKTTNPVRKSEPQQFLLHVSLGQVTVIKSFLAWFA